MRTDDDVASKSKSNVPTLADELANPTAKKKAAKKAAKKEAREARKAATGVDLTIRDAYAAIAARSLGLASIPILAKRLPMPLATVHAWLLAEEQAGRVELVEESSVGGLLSPENETLCLVLDGKTYSYARAKAKTKPEAKAKTKPEAKAKTKPEAKAKAPSARATVLAYLKRARCARTNAQIAAATGLESALLHNTLSSLRTTGAIVGLEIEGAVGRARQWEIPS